jgi:hypothetical protein
MHTFNKTVVSHEQFRAAITKHLEMDALVQQTYAEWEDSGKFRGCHVGCTLHDFSETPSDHSEYERLFGIPQVLARLFDATHEGLKAEDTPAFLAAIRDTIKPNQDLGMVWPQFALWLLADEANPYRLNQHESVAKEINAVADVYRAWIETGSPNLDAAYAADAARAAAYAADAARAARAADAARAAAYAAYAADAAADAAARAAAYAAYAADAADAADFWPTVRDKLIQLIANAPVMEVSAT